MGLLDLLGFSKQRKIVKEALENGALVVDVRSKEEYDNGHVEGSLNVPLNNIHMRVEELKRKDKTIVLCCVSGMRSGFAANLLKKHGIDCYNGGSWTGLR